jgi:hypothetical protein
MACQDEIVFLHSFYKLNILALSTSNIFEQYQIIILRWIDIVITKTLRELNRVTIFTRRSRKLINKMKELPKWPDVSSCSRHPTPLCVFYSVLCQFLTSLEFSILEKQCAISLYFVWWPMFKFCMLYCTAKNFHSTKNKNSVWPKTFYRRVRHFRIFQKNGITEFFYILLIVSFSSK